MNENIEEKVIDVTGIELTPGKPQVCLGNGEQGFECCCDECDYCLLCYPDFDAEGGGSKARGHPGSVAASRYGRGGMGDSPGGYQCHCKR